MHGEGSRWVWTTTARVGLRRCRRQLDASVRGRVAPTEESGPPRAASGRGRVWTTTMSRSSLAREPGASSHSSARLARPRPLRREGSPAPAAGVGSLVGERLGDQGAGCASHVACTRLRPCTEKTELAWLPASPPCARPCTREVGPAGAVSPIASGARRIGGPGAGGIRLRSCSEDRVKATDAVARVREPAPACPFELPSGDGVAAPCRRGEVPRERSGRRRGDGPRRSFETDP